MPFARPTLTALRNTAIQDITTSGVPGTDGLLRNSVLRVLAWVMSGLAYGLYGFLDWISRQSVPFTATDEYLEAWAALIGIYRKDATPASGSAQFSGNPETELPTDTPLMRGDGTPFATTAVGVIDATGFVTVPIIAEVAGASTNADAPISMNIAAPIPGINSAGVTVGLLTGGADQETTADFRTRMLAKYREPPQGGAIADYEQWALEVPGCTRVWVEGSSYGPGSVIVRPMFDDARSADNGFPQGSDGVSSSEPRGTAATGDQLLIADHIWPVQPVTALVYAVAPLAFPIDVELLALDPNTPEIQAGIIAALTDMYLVEAQVGGVIYPSQLYAAILTTPGINHFTMSEPSLPQQATDGYLPVMGTLTVTEAT